MGIRVAVYGSLRQGMGNHRLLEGSKFLGQDVIEGFVMYSLGAFPCVKSVWPDPDNSIVVEVYEVDDDTFARLDRLEGYPSFYDRRKTDTKFGDAWIYTIEERTSGIRVDHGDWVRFKGVN